MRRKLRHLLTTVLVAFAAAIIPAAHAQAHIFYIPTVQVGVFQQIRLPVRAEEIAPLTQVTFFLPEGLEVRSLSAEAPWASSSDGATATFSNGSTPQLEYTIFDMEVRYPSTGTLVVPFTLTYADGLERPHRDRAPVQPYPAALINVIDSTTTSTSPAQSEDAASEGRPLRLALFGVASVLLIAFLAWMKRR